MLPRNAVTATLHIKMIDSIIHIPLRNVRCKNKSVVQRHEIYLCVHPDPRDDERRHADRHPSMACSKGPEGQMKCVENKDPNGNYAEAGCQLYLSEILIIISFELRGPIHVLVFRVFSKSLRSLRDGKRRTRGTW
ncbi:hypothetical protein TNIN_117351 [Trichonephila inaurata madagascariensis]|uniref:Uncharacterized protein n=1 Tax=Trichonephila inaurata madagascariensis TaxID=2747483 RepID=A0A8X6XAK8_9ARAC|nr:hypothetical protein TNIN_117351 [Trichonephila inaurata madagascariensis]